jgi:hypothetical protein
MIQQDWKQRLIRWRTSKSLSAYCTFLSKEMTDEIEMTAPTRQR